MNAGTIAVVAVAVTIAMAAVWVVVEKRPNSAVRFLVICAAGIVIAGLGAVLIQFAADLERSISFLVPLAAIFFGITGIVTVVAASIGFRSSIVVLVLLAVTVSLGFVYADDGDQPSGRLELPARTSALTITEDRIET